MTVAPAQTRNAMNRALLARLTGNLGDRKTVTRLCNDFGQLYAAFLPDVFHSETNLNVKVGYVGCEMGLMGDLIAGLGEDVAISNVSLRNWCPHFVIACGNGFVITLMENLLGAMPDTVGEPVERPLSKIELDLASHEVKYRGNGEVLPAREFALMQALLERPGTILSRAQLEEKLYGWGEEVESNAIDVLIHYVRRKFDKDIIRNVRGAGWMVPK